MAIRMSKRFVDRAKAQLRRYQKILESARARTWASRIRAS
jgi:hypothetical protein